MNARNLLLGLGTFAAGTAALAVGAVALATRRSDAAKGAEGQHEPAPQPAAAELLQGPPPHDYGAPTGLEGHAVPELAPGQLVDRTTRASEAFRPDIDAPMTPAEREALRPATGPAPSLVSDRGGATQGAGGDLR